MSISRVPVLNLILEPDAPLGQLVIGRRRPILLLSELVDALPADAAEPNGDLSSEGVLHTGRGSPNLW